MGDVLLLRRAGAGLADSADSTGATRSLISAPILVDARRAAELLGVGLRTFRTMDAAGRLPAPVRLSRGIVRWRLEELRAWTEANCPDRETWEAINASRK